MSEHGWKDGAGDPTGEELLELTLAAQRGEPAARLRLAAIEARSPEAAAEAAELADFVAQLRGWLHAEERAAAPAQNRALARRVLARTTREDLSRWGDLGLAAHFVAARLRASGALRLAAASLLLHLLALPVVAWMVWTSPPAPPQIWFEPGALVDEPPYRAQEAEPEWTVEPLPLDDELALEALLEERELASYVENSLRWARWVLRAGLVVDLPPPGPGEGEPARLVRLRAARLADPSPLARDLPDPPARADGLQRALQAELLLDALILDGQPPAGLEEALAALLTGPGEPAPSEETIAGPEALLEAAALARAEAYGVLPRTLAPRLVEARAVLADDAGLHLRGAQAWLIAPFDPRWIELLARAAGPRLGPELLQALLDER